MNTVILISVAFAVLSIVLIVRSDYREKLKNWFPGIILFVSGVLFFSGRRSKKQEPNRHTIPTKPGPPPIKQGAVENDFVEEIKANIHLAKHSNRDDAFEYLRNRANEKSKN